MSLKLVMTRCPDSVVPEQRELRGGEFHLGRGLDNEWVIADPDRHLSKRHCRFAYRSGAWEITDFSSNGTFLNRASTPLGAGTTRVLRDGDLVSFGNYELEVSITDDAASSGLGFAGSATGSGFGGFAPTPDTAPPGAGMAGGFGGFAPPPGNDLNPFLSRPEDRRQDDMRLDDRGLFGETRDHPILPHEYDPLARPDEPFFGPTQSDHAPALDSAFRPPPPVSIIPDDWDPSLPAGLPANRPAAPADPPAMAPVPAQPAPPVTAAPVAPSPVAPSPAPSPVASDVALLRAFLRGAGMAETNLADPEKTLEQVGAALRAAVAGIRQVLMARASIKDEFRIEQTMVQATGNNPLKFAVDDDDALAKLLGLGRPTGFTAVSAINEALRDMRLHELAAMAAMQAAARALLAKFDPAAIERAAANSALDILPGQRKARAWDAFASLHQSVTQALSDDFDSVFGKAFARAYEQAVDELGAREPAS